MDDSGTLAEGMADSNIGSHQIYPDGVPVSAGEEGGMGGSSIEELMAQPALICGGRAGHGAGRWTGGLAGLRVGISDFGVVLATSGIARRSIFRQVLANWAGPVQSCPVLPHIDPG